MRHAVSLMLVLLLCATALQATEWTALFDGETLSGWHRAGHVNGTAEYTVEDGAIVGTTKTNTPNSFLCADKPYANFILELEYKVPQGMNSGVQIRSISDPAVKRGRVHGYQVEIDPSSRAWSAGIYDEARRGWLYNATHIEKERGKEAAEAAKKAFKPDSWNSLRVEAVGPHIRTWLNGVPVADLKDDMTPKGVIALQVHGTKDPEPKTIRWRNIRIKDFGDKAGTTRDLLGPLKDTIGMAPPPDARVLLSTSSGLDAWEPQKGETIGWTLDNGVLTVAPGSGSIQTKEPVQDVKLHAEFRVNAVDAENVQNHGNSGIYIQRRYEVQILNSHGRTADPSECGAIYRTKAPDKNASRPAGEWQSYDIVFRGARYEDKTKAQDARISVLHNGILIHDNVAIPNKTGSGDPEGPDPAPISLQDHGNPVAFRNIWVQDLQTLVVAESKLDTAWRTMLAWTFGDSRRALIEIENAVRDAEGAARADLEARLVQSLDHPQATADAKRFMCRMLGRIGGERAIEPLARLLLDPEFSTDARKALADMPSPAVDTVFQNALQADLPKQAKTGLIVSIGDRGRADSVNAILPFVSSDDADVRRVALEALGSIGTPNAEHVLRQVFAEVPADRAAGRALLGCAEHAANKRQMPRATEICTMLLSQAEDGVVRAGALRILGDADAKQAIPHLVRALRDGSEAEQDVAVRLVRDMPDDTVIRETAAILGELEPAVTVALLNAYAARGGDMVAEAAAAHLDSDQDAVRAAAAEVLGRAGGTQHIEALAKLSAAGGAAGNAAAKALTAMSAETATETLLMYLGSDAPNQTKAAVVDALVARASYGAVPAIIDLTRTAADRDLQRELWRALRELATADQLPSLIDAFFIVTDTRVKRDAEKALAAAARGVSDSEQRADMLLAGLERAPDAAKPVLASMLSLAPAPRTERALVALLESRDKTCRYEAVKALGTWKTGGPYDALKAYAERTEELTHNVLALRGCLRLLDMDSSMPEDTRLAELDRLDKVARRPEEKALIKAARTDLRITQIKAKNNKPYVLVRRGFAEGNKVYIDRDYVFTEIPDILAGADHIKIAMEDKYSKGDDWLSFTISRAATVIVAYDGRAQSRPAWLQDWKKLGSALRSTDRGCPLELFAKRFPAGKVVLPGNNPVRGVGAMYTVGITSIPVE